MDENLINVDQLRPFPRFFYTIGILPTSFKMSYTYEEGQLEIIRFIKEEIIPNVNKNALATKELQEKFVELVNYVNTYFDNLDLQDEVNAKLEDMVEDGTLQEIITEYINLKSILAFNNVSELKNATNLIAGSFVETYGYTSKNDGGSAKYYIREIINTDVVDNATIIALDNYEDLVAVLIVENSTIPVELFGAVGNGITDDTQAIQNCIDYCTLNNLTCFFNNKVYLTSSPLEIKEVSVLSGGVTNDEYNTQARIKNITTNMITITTNVVGAKIKNLCFISDKTKQLYFLQTNNQVALEWCEISNCGFREFYKVFDCYTLGCRFEKLWINYGKLMGILHGSDNTIKDCWIGSPLATSSEDLLVLDGYGLSRLENLYFTGKVDNNTGCNNILKIGGYCNNLQFDGCYFDFSNGSAVTILGQANDFPNSGATNISFNNCLFRGNCCNQETITHIINADYCRNVNVINCSFSTQTRYTENANSKVYNFGQYSQGVMLFNNFYGTPFSANGSYINNASMIEPYNPSHFNNIGYNYYDNTMFLKNQAGTKKLFHKRDTFTTGATYGEVTMQFAENMGDHPIVAVTVENSNWVATINQITSTQVQVIIKNITNGSAVLNSNVTLDVIAISN